MLITIQSAAALPWSGYRNLKVVSAATNSSGYHQSCEIYVDICVRRRLLLEQELQNADCLVPAEKPALTDERFDREVSLFDIIRSLPNVWM